MPVDVVIVGAGIAGLSAAFELSRQGVSVHLIERDTRPGGSIRTEQTEGFIIDGGADSLLVQKRAGLELCRELGIANRLVPTSEPRVSFVLRGGRLHPLPEGSVLGIPIRFGSLARSRLFSARAKIRIAMEWLIPPGHDRDDESIAGFVGRRFGREASTYIAEPLLAGIHAGDASRLSVKALFPRLVEAEREHRSVLRALRKTPAPDSDGIFRSFPEGLGELVGRLAEALPAGTLHTGTSVRSVAREETYAVNCAPEPTLHARAVVLATPTYVTADLLRQLDDGLATELAAVPYASSAAVVVAYRRSDVGHPLQGSGFVVPRQEGRTMTACTWASSKWPGRAPADHVLLRAYVGGTRDPGALDRGDDALLSTVERELGAILEVHGRPVMVRVYRWACSNPQYEVGHLVRVRTIERMILRHPGLFVTGAGLRGVGVADCIADGRATGRAAIEWLRAAR